MIKPQIWAAAACLFFMPAAGQAQDLCEGFGPQTPRDIASRSGTNARLFTMAPPASKMNLCNIHTHTNAEHKGPGFSNFAGGGEHGGYRCNNTDQLTDMELADPHEGHGPYGNVKPGDTIEVHWVHTTCEIDPGEGLGSCLSESCANPQLRVEAQVFLLVNDENAADFADYLYDGNVLDGLHQAKALPQGSGDPVIFAGSTTGPKFTSKICSPMQVTWSVRPECIKLDINSLHAWAERGNIFNEVHSHGVRQLVTAGPLLAPID